MRLYRRGNEHKGCVNSREFVGQQNQRQLFKKNAVRCKILLV